LNDKLSRLGIKTLDEFLSGQILREEILKQFKAFKTENLFLTVKDESRLIDLEKLSKASTQDTIPETVEGRLNRKEVRGEISYVTNRSVRVAIKRDGSCIKRFGFAVIIGKNNRAFRIFDREMERAEKILIGLDGQTVPFARIQNELELAKKNVILSDEDHWAVFADELNKRLWKITRTKDGWRIESQVFAGNNKAEELS
jgi:hypothetical protein